MTPEEEIVAARVRAAGEMQRWLHRGGTYAAWKAEADKVAELVDAYEQARPFTLIQGGAR